MRLLRTSIILPLLFVAVAARPADAQTQVGGFELERLELDPSGIGSLVLPSARLMVPGTFRVASALTYVNSPLLAVVNDTAVGAVVAHRATLQITGAWTVFSRLEIAAALPIVLLQLGDDLSAYGISPPGVIGLGNPYVLARTNILEAGESLVPFDLGAQLGVGLPLGSFDVLASSSPGLVFSPKLLMGREVGGFVATGELGLDLRPAVALGIEEYGPRMTLGASVLALQAPHPAMRGLRPEAAVKVRVPFTGQIPAAELLLGARLPLKNALNAFMLLGAGLGRAPGTPRFLISVGASFDNATGAPRANVRIAPKPEGSAPRPEADGPAAEQP